MRHQGIEPQNLVICIQGIKLPGIQPIIERNTKIWSTIIESTGYGCWSAT